MNKKEFKSKRRVVGSICKAKDGGRKYIKVSEDFSMSKGQFINIVSKSDRLELAERLLSEGKISEEIAQKMVERANKIPDFVLAELEITQE